MNLKNKKNIIITGASGQVGSGLVELLKTEFNVIPIVRSIKNDDTQSKYFSCKNLANKDECLATFDEIIKQYKTIDCLINVAGGFDMGEIIENQSWEQMLNINFHTMLNATSCVLKNMKKNNSGKIINFGSVAGVEGMGMAGPYSVSKAAVHNLSKTINLETPRHISSHVLVLSIIDTLINREAMPDADFSTWISIESIAEKISMIINNKESNELLYFD
tara:strand:+ start:528 stop:1184 length:657 start_codon:yes stop_codon:yes gene_type:complete